MSKKEYKNVRSPALKILDIKQKDEGRYRVFFSNVPVPVEMNKDYLQVVFEELGTSVNQFKMNKNF